MTSYTVTIAPDDPDLAVATIRLDITDASATIRELRLVPGSNGGLTPGGLPVLDLNQLVAAVVAAVVPTSAAAGAEPTVAATPARKANSANRPAPRKAARKRAAHSAQVEVEVAKPRKKATAKTPVAKANKAAKKAAAAATSERGGRNYRRVPDDFDQVLRQAGESASIISDHYGVPRHTAYSWIRSARKRSAEAA